jgi:hypothetical protein
VFLGHNFHLFQIRKPFGKGESSAQTIKGATFYITANNRWISDTSFALVLLFMSDTVPVWVGRFWDRLIFALKTLI